MKGKAFYRVGGIIAAVASIAFAGCLGKSQSVRFYTLSTVATDPVDATAPNPAHNAAVGIGPIQVADYLDQSKIVTRSGDNRIKQAEYDHWAGALGDNLINVLAENIGFMVPTDRIYLYPWRRSLPIDYHVKVDIVRCDGRLGEAAVLVARWSLLTNEDKTVLAVKRTSITQAVRGDGYEELVAAQSQALAQLSREIADAIRAAGRARPVG